MKPYRRHAIATAVSLVPFAIVPSTLASCASDEDGNDRVHVESSIAPEGGADASLEAAVEVPIDGGCDASDPKCVTTPISCEEASWCPVPTGLSPLHVLAAVWGSAKDDVWASGSGGTILHWDGTKWAPTPTSEPVKHTFRAIWGSSGRDVWIASATDMVFHSNGFANGAATWVRAPNATGEESTRPIFAAWGTPGGPVRFGGRGHVVYDFMGDKTLFNQFVARPNGDGGVDWSIERGTATITGMWGSSADDLWLVGDNSENVTWQLGWSMRGTRTAKGTFAWVELDTQASGVLEAVWGSSASDVWAVGDKGTIRHIAAGDTQWEIVTSPTKEPLHGLWGSSPNDVWAVGDSGTILHWDGATWSPSVAALPVNKKKPHLYGIWGSGPDDVWIVGDGIALHHTGGTK
ncbi:MAG: hypothetical protein BGO98_18075 [Myxococcales bacterium 68-20]|nr:hypothetical protein [Myxococcales bacterium]OJY23847.1 MAG: hypothetical protein BGO98_18075 [Myxococcales bacterium 68-20]